MSLCPLCVRACYVLVSLLTYVTLILRLPLYISKWLYLSNSLHFLSFCLIILHFFQWNPMEIHMPQRPCSYEIIVPRLQFKVIYLQAKNSHTQNESVKCFFNVYLTTNNPSYYWCFVSQGFIWLLCLRAWCATTLYLPPLLTLTHTHTNTHTLPFPFSPSLCLVKHLSCVFPFKALCDVFLHPLRLLYLW